MEERKVSLSCLKDIADENGRFYKVFQDTALKLSKEIEIHMDNLEAAIERTYDDNEELPEKLESIYLTELSLYEKFVDFLQGANEIMHKSNEEKKRVDTVYVKPGIVKEYNREYTIVGKDKEGNDCEINIPKYALNIHKCTKTKLNES